MNGDITGRGRSSRGAAGAVVVAVVVVVVVVVVVAFAVLRNGSDGEQAAAPGTPSPTQSVSVTSPPATTPSPTASPTPSPSVAAPVLPDEAKQPTTKGAAAFFRYFWDTYNFAFLALDPDPLREISAPDCAFCRSAVGTVTEIRSNSATVVGGEVTVVAAVAQPGDARDPGLVVISQLTQAAGRTVNEDGSTRASSDSSERRLDALVKWEEGRWLLVGVDTATD